MAQSGIQTGGLTGYSLTGYLGLYQKSRFKGQYRNYWFWFDEQTCSLKYYRNMEIYLQKVHEPLGCIDLRYAKVTPDITGGKTSKSFHISINNQLYVLSAENVTEALTWIEKLQEKRSEYIKMSSAMEENAQEQEREKRAFRPLSSQPGSLLASNDQHGTSPPSVRKIISTKLQYANERQSVHLDLVQTRSERVVLPSPVRSLDGDSSNSKMDDGQRRVLELETSYLETQEEVARLHKEVLRLSSVVGTKDKEVLQANTELAQLKEEIAKVNTPQSELRLENESLKDVLEQYKRSLKTLDDEINLHKLNQREHDKRIASERARLSETERDLLEVKAKYVKLYSEKFKPTVQGDEGVFDPGEDRNNSELLSLLKQESGENPVFEGYRVSFEDQYGDLHDWQSGVTTQLYLCRQLYIHYNSQENDRQVEEWVHYLSQMKRSRGKQHLDLPSVGDRSKKRELRNLLRKGLPIQFRTKVWQSLVYRVIGRTKEVRDSSAGKDTTYYQSLVQAKQTSLSEKQIRLDLYRTLPSNIHFKIGGKGAPKLENILLAFSRHNRNVGYCQGMNMVAAVGLLFLDEELDFWFLVAIIEKLMPPHYFSPGLLAAQADQAVVRELVADRLPRLHAHLQRYSIDVTLVTFNWFLTLFVDALPTETVLRILDCFLLEGEKVLFRMSLGILKINEKKVLSLTDPVALFQFLKEVARHTYDIEALFQAAFVDLNPFPSRSYLTSRHQHHFVIARDQWNNREKQREVFAKKQQITSQNQLRDLAPAAIAVASLVKLPARRRLVWECGCARGREEVWMCCTENQEIHLKVIKSGSSREVLEVPINPIGSRVICIYYVEACDMVLLGTLDFFIHAVHCTSHQVLWSQKLNDSVLAITGSQQDNTVFAAMADGCVAIIQALSHTAPDEPPLLLRVGTNYAVQCLSLNQNKGDLWCGCGKAITVMSTESFEVTQSLVMPDAAGKVYKMESGTNGVWVSFRASCLLCLYDLDYYVKLLQLDYTAEVSRENLLPIINDSHTAKVKSRWEYRITCLMADDRHLWVGTGSGTLYLFAVIAGVPNPGSRVRALAKQSGGDPLSPAGQLGSHRERLGPDVTDGGLLSSVVADEEASGSHLDRRRKTAFGWTFRGGSRSSALKGDSPGVYKLKFEESHQPLSTTNESVKTLIGVSDKGEQCLLSCINDPGDWQNGVQLWKIDSSTEKWSFGFISPKAEAIPTSALADSTKESIKKSL